MNSEIANQQKLYKFKRFSLQFQRSQAHKVDTNYNLYQQPKLSCVFQMSPAENLIVRIILNYGLTIKIQDKIDLIKVSKTQNTRNPSLKHLDLFEVQYEEFNTFSLKGFLCRFSKSIRRQYTQETYNQIAITELNQIAKNGLHSSTLFQFGQEEILVSYQLTVLADQIPRSPCQTECLNLDQNKESYFNQQEQKSQQKCSSYKLLQNLPRVINNNGLDEEQDTTAENCSQHITQSSNSDNLQRKRFNCQQNQNFHQSSNEEQIQKKSKFFRQRGDKKNVVKNFVKAFRAFLLNWGQEDDFKKFDLFNSTQLNSYRQDWVEYEKGQKYNNRLIKELIQHSKFSEGFVFFLQYKAKDWLMQSAVMDKKSHFEVLRFYISASYDTDQMGKIICLRSRQMQKNKLQKQSLFNDNNAEICNDNETQQSSFNFNAENNFCPHQINFYEEQKQEIIQHF